MDIESLRNEIDATDREIASLISHRYDLTDAIGAIKKTGGKTVRNPEREKVVIENAKNAADSRYEDEIQAIFEQIIALSRNRQENMIEES